MSHLAKTGHGVPIHLLTLAVTLQAHGSIDKFTHFPGGDRKIERDPFIIDLRVYPHHNIDSESTEDFFFKACHANMSTSCTRQAF